MGRSARWLGVRVASAAAMTAVVLVVTAPLAGAKPAPPPSAPATTTAPGAKPAATKPKAQPATTAAPTPTTAPATTATTTPPEAPGFGAAKTGDPGAGDAVLLPPFPGGPIDPPPDPQPNPRVTVSPNTDLQDGQTVQVDATGYTPNASVGTAQCRAGATDVSDCDLGHSIITTSDGDGAWSASLVVGARSRVGSEVVDCREAGACVIGAARTSDYKEQAGSSLAFAPGIVLPPPPSVSATPDSDLVHDQLVTLTGTGFAPGDHVYAQQCVDRDPYAVCSFTFAPGDIVADDTGTATTPFTVERLIGYPGEQLVDCADARCYLQMSSQNDQFATGRAELEFDPDGALPPRPTASASPHRDLVHDQTIEITGSGFSPFEDLRISQCSVAADPYPVCSYPGITGPIPVPIGLTAGGQVDGDGNLSATFNVRRQLGYPGPGGFVVDCAEKPGCGSGTSGSNASGMSTECSRSA